MSLRIPGPTPCPEKVLHAMSKQMINHRGKEFGEMMVRITAKLKDLFQTKGDVFILTSSGTGSMEASIVNTLSPGDKVLSLSNGVFGDRYATIAEQFGAVVTRVKFEWGKAIEPAAADKALKADPGIKAVLVTHNETSTGVTNDLGAVASIVRKHDKLLLVDAISSLGCIDLPVDKWGCDVVVTGSQKGWMVPPGLAFVSVSERAWQAHKTAKMPRFYWDFTRAKEFLQKNQTPWTPAVSIFYALDIALPLMLEEGLPNIFARHARLGRKAREGVKSLGLTLYAEEKVASDTVTAVNAPPGVDGKKITEIMRDEHGIVLSGGQSTLAGKIFRIGHLGFVTDSEIDDVIRELRHALPKAGYKIPHK
ncbi:MAG: alanine--glyoxylate aminotransferase family protein [Chloroflexi bacterium]|nr:alanine--glyoxylate aminotransferase family protein [Chloroflexota bacterium]